MSVKGRPGRLCLLGKSRPTFCVLPSPPPTSYSFLGEVLVGSAWSVCQLCPCMTRCRPLGPPDPRVHPPHTPALLSCSCC